MNFGDLIAKGSAVFLKKKLSAVQAVFDAGTAPEKAAFQASASGDKVPLNYYNVNIDASNYERAIYRWTANVLHLGTEAAGTGVLRGVQFNGRYGFGGAPDGYNNFKLYSPDGGGLQVVGPGSIVNRFTAGGGGALVFDNFSASGTYWRQGNVDKVVFPGLGGIQVIKQAAQPVASANTATLFLEDNGAGKMRLMARFPSGASVQLGIEP